MGGLDISTTRPHGLSVLPTRLRSAKLPKRRIRFLTEPCRGWAALLSLRREPMTAAAMAVPAARAAATRASMEEGVPMMVLEEASALLPPVPSLVVALFTLLPLLLELELLLLLEVELLVVAEVPLLSSWF